MIFSVSCPLFPYEKGSNNSKTLPQRMRPDDCLSLEKLCSVLKKALVNELEYKEIKISIVSVVSPYTHLCHVMLLNLDSNLYIPSIERCSPEIARCFFDSALNILNNLGTNNCCQCVGYNWSPYSYGIEEEKGGAQSVTTKLHISVWQWEELKKIDLKDIPKQNQHVFGYNDYLEPFSMIINDCIGESDFFHQPEIVNGSVLFRFKDNVTTSLVLKNPQVLYSFSKKIAEKLGYLSYLITGIEQEFLFSVLSNIEHRKLNESEIMLIRSIESIKPLEEIVSRCRDANEIQFITVMYPYINNRMNSCTDLCLKWRKNFGYSLVMCDSVDREIYSGLYILPLPLCGSGGVAEALGCYLTRPETQVAPDDLLKQHNFIIDALSERIELMKNK